MSRILRSVSLATVTILLCGLLTSAYAQKTPKTPKTPKTQEQIEKFQKNHPDAGTPATAKKPTPVAWQAPANGPNGGNAPSYYNSGQNNGNRPNGGNAPSYYNSGQSNGNRPTRIDDDRRDDGRYEYVGRPSDSGRAYEMPRRDHDWDRECNRDCHRDDHHHSWNQGGWGHPAPIRIVVSQPIYIPAPAPRYGGTPAYYPQAHRPWNAPNCGDINRMPLLGSEIIAADGTFLGVIDRDYGGPESIANSRSAFGSPYSRLSIWNPDSAYGSPVGAYSPWNRDCYRPPVLYWHGVFRGYLSTNPDMQPKVSPSSLPEHIQISPWR
jgi:hypothetical protein